MEKEIEEMAWELCDIPKHPSIKNCEQCGNKQCHAIYYAKRAIEKGYTKQVQGEWKFYKVRSYGVSITHELVCNRCGIKVEMLQGRHYKYCPNCGAQMKGAEQ